MLSLKVEKGKTIPEMTCDLCGKEIQPLIQGIISFEHANIDFDIIPIHTFHKGKCDPRERFSIEIHEYFSGLLGHKETETEEFKNTKDFEDV